MTIRARRAGVPCRLYGVAAASFCALAAAGLASCGQSSTGPAPPNVLLITLDTVRADHCSAYGYERPTTPTLERMAEAGVLFERAYAPMATTGPAHATLFTSLPPLAHGVLKNGHTLREDFDTLAEILSGRGYRTGAVVSSFVMHGKFGYRQGFTDYDDDFGKGDDHSKPLQWEGHVVTGQFDQDARVTTDKATAWLRKRPTPGSAARGVQPFFLWVHYYDAHAPYAPPPPWRDRLGIEPLSDSLQKEIANYDAEILEVDDAISSLLDVLAEMELDDSTLVVVVGDHGEGLMQHDWMLHSLFVYEEAVRVPLLLRWPAHLPRGLRPDGPVKVADLMPTILELTNTSADDLPMQGMSLVAAMRDEIPIAADRNIYLQRRHYASMSRASNVYQSETFEVKGDKFAIVVGTLKYIEAPEERSYELYDLEHDPGETRNLIATHPDEAERLAIVLERWKHTVAVDHPEQTISPLDDQKLKGIGYTQ